MPDDATDVPAAEPRREIFAGQILTGLAAGAAVPVLLGAIMSWPLVHYVIAVVAIAVAPYLLLVGFPVALFLRGRGLLTASSATMLGGCLYGLPVLIYFIWQLLQPNDLLRSPEAFFFALLAIVFTFGMGAISGSFGWWFAMRATPSVDEPPKKKRFRPSP